MLARISKPKVNDLFFRRNEEGTVRMKRKLKKVTEEEQSQKLFLGEIALKSACIVDAMFKRIRFPISTQLIKRSMKHSIPDS